MVFLQNERDAFVMSKHVLKMVISISVSHCMPCEETVEKLRRRSPFHLVTKSNRGTPIETAVFYFCFNNRK